MFSHREEAARQLEESEDPQTPEASPNKSGEWRESDSGMEWVISSGKKNSTAKNKQPGKSGSDEVGKDLDDEETFTNGKVMLYCTFYHPWFFVHQVLVHSS